MSTVIIKIKNQPNRTILATDYEAHGKLKGVAKLFGFKLNEVEEIRHIPDAYDLQEKDLLNIKKQGFSNNDI